MARKSQVKAIVARGKTKPAESKVKVKINSSDKCVADTQMLSRAAKRAHVKRAPSLTKTPPSPLAQKMHEDLQLAGMSERTAESYLRAVRKLAVYCRKSPDLIDEEELRG